jgi:hypothetical protein
VAGGVGVCLVVHIDLNFFFSSNFTSSSRGDYQSSDLFRHNSHGINGSASGLILVAATISTRKIKDRLASFQVQSRAVHGPQRQTPESKKEQLHDFQLNHSRAIPSFALLLALPFPSLHQSLIPFHHRQLGKLDHFLHREASE